MSEGTKPLWGKKEHKEPEIACSDCGKPLLKEQKINSLFGCCRECDEKRLESPLIWG